jgi:DNA-binding SARP family transcriptional activator
VGSALTINMIGDFQVLSDGTPVALPPSRKTRALFAYLAATGETVRRERLCEMFWNIPDDPKGALRWSLSKIRGVLGETEKARLQADREAVRLDTTGLATDIASIQALKDGCSSALDVARLETLAALFRGEFLEGLDLPNAHTFHAWCQAERETMRTRRKSILSALLEKLSQDPDRALPHARRLVDLDPLDEDLRAQLIGLLVAAGRTGEAAAVYRSGRGRRMEDRPGADPARCAGGAPRSGSTTRPALIHWAG